MSHFGNDALKEQIYEEVLDQYPHLGEYECEIIVKYRYEESLET